MPPIVAFLTGAGPDGAGRRLADVLAMDDGALERHHDFIQWLFPLDEPSRAVPGSPVLDDESLSALRVSDRARDNQGRAAARMLAFYAATTGWLAPFDHNHLRITRIVRSLRLISGDAAADAFKARIAELSDGAPVDATARHFWRAA